MLRVPTFVAPSSIAGVVLWLRRSERRLTKFRHTASSQERSTSALSLRPNAIVSRR